MPATRIIDQDPAYVGGWMQDHSSTIYRAGATCIGLERHGQLVAGVLYDYCNGASIFAHIVIRGLVTRQWLWFITYYPFVQCGCDVLIGLVAEVNTRARQFVERFGFLLQTALPQADPDGALCVYTLKKSDCRFLERPYYGETQSSSRT
jgi:hypothetical protein